MTASSQESGYQRGYAAGRRRTADEDANRRRIFDREYSDRKTFEREAALQIMCAMITASRPWQVGDKPVATGEQYADIAYRTAQILTQKVFQ